MDTKRKVYAQSATEKATTLIVAFFCTKNARCSNI